MREKYLGDEYSIIYVPVPVSLSGLAVMPVLKGRKIIKDKSCPPGMSIHLQQGA